VGARSEGDCEVGENGVDKMRRFVAVVFDTLRADCPRQRMNAISRK